MDGVLAPKIETHSITEFIFEPPVKAVSGLLKQKTLFEDKAFYTTPGFKPNTNVIVTKSALLDLLLVVEFNENYSKQIFLASKSMLLLLLAGLFFPVLGFLIKGPNIYFLMSVRWSQIAIPLMILFIALEQSKIIAVL